MDLALPYVTANLCALFIVGFLASTGNSRSARLRQVAASRARRQAQEKQVLALAVQESARQQKLAKSRSQAQAQARAMARGPTSAAPGYKPKTMEPKITGAGVLLIQMVHDDLTVILVKQGLKFTDPGGTREQESPQQCATRELEEETLGTIILDISSAPAFPVKHVEYQGMFVAVDINLAPIVRKFYILTRDSIRDHDPDVDPAWKETTDLREFYIADIQGVPQSLAASLMDTYDVVDTEGEVLKVSERVIGLVRLATQNGTLDTIKANLTSGTNVVKLYQGLNKDGIGKRGTAMRTRSTGKTVSWSTTQPAP